MTRKDNLIYIASFFDCEGSVQIRLRKTPKGYKPCHIRMSFSNNNKKVLESFIPFLGYGHITERRRKKLRKSGSPFKKNPYSLIVVGAKAKSLLVELLPYLRVKRDHAKLCIKYPLIKRGGRLSKKVIRKKLEIRKRLHFLNKRDNERDISSWIDLDKKGGN